MLKSQERLSRFLKSQAHFILLVSLGFLLMLCVGLGVSPAQAQTASQLNQQGFELLHRGAAADALKVWQSATAQYQTEENLEGVQGSQLNQTLAMQALGLHPRACQKLVEILELPSEPCRQDFYVSPNPELMAQALSNLPANEINRIGLRLLGENLRLLGKLAESEKVLLYAQTFPRSEDQLEEARLTLALGATYQLSLQAALEGFSRTDFSDVQLQQRFATQINSAAEQAANQYQALIANPSTPPGLALQARLNLFDLFIDFRDRTSQFPSWAVTDLSSLQILKPMVSGVMMDVLEETAGFESLPAIEGIYGRLNLAKNLLIFETLSSLNNALDRSHLGSRRWMLVEDAVAISTAVNDKRALSAALGARGALLEAEHHPPEQIKASYTQALALAQAVQASDMTYQWEYKLAKLYEAQGQFDLATQGYQSAIDSLFQVRENLLSVNSELRFSFRKNIEPVYRDYIKLLATQPTQTTLAEVVNVYESLQLAELENYLGCGRLGTAEVNQSEMSLDSTLINIIKLGDAIQVVVRTPDDNYFGYSVPITEVLPAADALVANLQSATFIEVPEADILPYAQTLYQALIAPAREEGVIPEQGELTFILDTPFQGIPMAMLHDGQQYLIESHRISNSLQPQQRVIQQLDSARALVAGLSEESPSFRDPLVSSQLQPLPDTEFEVQGVEKYLSANVLLNEAFTANRLEREASKDYEVVHISTHGQFSSDPSQTFLMAWDELIGMDQMYRIFQDERPETGIDLLVLSACQTATGDERSVLGMAGIAVQAGARSTVASLWLVDSASSAVLMEEFYKELSSGMSKSEALRQAQLLLLNSTAFNHPFYWASFIFAEGGS